MVDLCKFDQGMVLLAGVTGSGKSTTIASMLNWINAHYKKHILTLEDPIEFVFTDDQCLINQREIGLDVKNFEIGMKHAVREDPDVMLVGEMRDRETFMTAIHAAETGHLVFGTIHAASAASTIGRILDLFPPDMHAALRSAIAFNMRGIVAQKLLPSIKEGVGRVPTVEIMTFTPMVKKLLLDEKDEKLRRSDSHVGQGGNAGFHDEPQGPGEPGPDRSGDRFGSRAQRGRAEDGTQGYRSRPTGDSVSMRFALVVLGAAALWSAGAEMSLAADAAAWPDYDIPFQHGPGYYLSLWKLAPIWLLFAAWVSSADWVSRDTRALRLNYSFWNNLVVFAFFAAYLLVWLMPSAWAFWLTFPLMIIAYAVPLGFYVRERNSQVPFGEQVLTKRHLKKWFVAKLVLLRLKKGDEGEEEGPEVQFKALGAASDSDNSVNLLTAKENPGFLPARQLVADAMQHRASSIMLEYTAEAAQVRHQVDGVWHDQPPIDRVLVGDPVLEVFKVLANCNPTDRAARQAGLLLVETKAAKYTLRFTSQGTKTGERAVLQMEGKKLTFGTLEELGMRPKMVEQLTEFLSNKGGVFVFTALPGGGLSTLVDVTLNAVDRFTRNFAACRT